MCGIGGFIDTKSCAKTSKENLRNMAATLKHRGPDNEGIYYNNISGVGLLHTRLSILDLSEDGNQPMFSKKNKYVISFNGEIYNYKELKDKLYLEGVDDWNSNSDTEILLECIYRWGLTKALKKSIGMFAFALYNIENNTVSLCRDRAGEKPLSYFFNKNKLIFSSELKAIKTHKLFTDKINSSAIKTYFRYGYVNNSQSIYEDTFKVYPGQIVTFSLKHNKIIKSDKFYWTTTKNISKKKAHNESAKDLQEILLNSVKMQTRSDVPLGAFLSSGIDSSLIVSMMQKSTSKTINTFTVGFNEEFLNEAKQAKKIANYLGTNHSEIYFDQKQIINLIQHNDSLYDEPFSDSSQFPTFLVSEFAKTKVTVALSGDGGDELFGGYERYRQSYSNWRRYKFLSLLAPSFLIEKTPLLKNKKLENFRKTRLLNINTFNDFYKLVTLSNNIDPSDLLMDKTSKISNFRNQEFDFQNSESNMMNIDFLNYLPDNILTKVDRASMISSLEVRSPFLDHNVIEFANKLDLRHKIGKVGNKLILREILYNYIPKDFFSHKKTGFGLPIRKWLLGDLYEWCEFMFEKKNLTISGYLDYDKVIELWDLHKRGKGDYTYQLWDILMFQKWYLNK